MKLKVKKEEIKDFIEKMVEQNYKVNSSTKVIDFIYTHHKLDNLDKLSEIIKSYETINNNALFNEKYFNKVVINEKSESVCYPTVCGLKEEIIDTPFEPDKSVIECIASLYTIAECVSLHPTLTEIALKKEGYEDTSAVCSLDEIKESLQKYIILHDYNYLMGGFYENSTILAVDGNFALLIHNSYLTEDDKVDKSK